MTDKKFTEEEWLARCRTVYQLGFARRELMQLLYNWVDALLRYEHTLFSVGGQTQGRDWYRFLEAENERLGDAPRTLAGDVDGYTLIQVAAILAHPCQQCAESTTAWHTRSGFCEHREPGTA